MYSIVVVVQMITILYISSSIGAAFYSDRYDYDAYGTRLTSTDYFVVLARNDAHQYDVSMASFGIESSCMYNYRATNHFVISVAAGR